MKRLAAAAATLVFSGAGLVGCGSQDEQPSSPPTVSSSPSETTSAAFTHQEVRVGETFDVGEMGDHVNLTITELTVGGDCRYGVNDYGLQPEAEEEYLQIWAEVEPVQLNHNTWTMLSDPKFVDEEDFTQSLKMDSECRPSNDGFESWSQSVDQGEKIRVYGVFHIPSEAKELKFESYRLPLNEAAPNTATVRSPEATVNAEQVESAPYVTECLEGTPGPALWSDGEVRHSEDCFHKLGGPAYLEQESQSGLKPGGAAVNGYGYDEFGRPNKTSGELQAEWGCQQGYITDPAICSHFE